MKLLVIGTGYVGLVTGTCFAEMGHEVICLDIDTNKIDGLNRGEIPIYEPGLQEMVLRNAREKRLFFTTNYAAAAKNSDVCFIAVSTPSSDSGACDLSYVFQAAESLAEHMDGYKLIVNKSTVPVGTAGQVRSVIQDRLNALGKSVTFDIASNPEFLKEGAAISDCMKPDRIIIGVESERARTLMEELYAPFSISQQKILFMDVASAEMTKYASNAMLALRISFMNELSELCEKLGANINQIRLGMGTDVRIGPHFLYAGAGFGGSCFPKDIRALRHMGKECDVPMPIMDAVETINKRQKQALLRKMMSYFSTKGGLQSKTIAIWGLSFKPDTDDIREAPALELIGDLLKAGAHVRLYDPIAQKNAKVVLKDQPHITWCKDEYEAAHSSHAIALVTDWKQFRFVDFEKVVSGLQERAFFDGRNQYRPKEMKSRGFAYFGIGIPGVTP